MAMTSDELARDLRDIDQLIAVLNAPEEDEIAYLDDLKWLLARRRSMSDLLAVRRAQRGKKVVSLAIWRCGCPTEAERVAGIA
jgi:hypothetical protein